MQNLLKEKTANFSRKQNESQVEERWRLETLKRAQANHLAAALFPLDDLIVEPRLLAPPLQHEPGTPYPPEEILSSALSYLPDWPEIPARVNERTLSIVDALNSGFNLVVTGAPGIGKTVMLAYLVSLLAKKDPLVEKWENYLPIYFHVAQLFIDEKSTADPITPILNIFANFLPNPYPSKIPGLLQTAVKTGRAFLIIDGIDEISVADHKAVVHYLAAFQKAYPSIRIVVTGTRDYLGQLLRMHFYPFAMAAWSENQSILFLSRWEEQWNAHIKPDVKDDVTGLKKIDPFLLNNWILSEKSADTPFDLTLRTWAAYTGDSRGPARSDGIEVYLSRLIPDRETRQALELAAISMVTTSKTFFESEKISTIISLSEPASSENKPEDRKVEVKTGRTNRESVGTSKFQRLLPGVISSGLIVDHQHDRFSFSHPLFLGYLASFNLSTGTRVMDVISTNNWTGRKTTLQYYVAREQNQTPVQLLLEEDKELFFQGTFEAARWLKDAKPSTPWSSMLLRRLVELIQRDNLPLAVRHQCLAALVLSNDPGIPVLFRQWHKSDNLTLRQIGLIGCGLIQDPKCLSDLSANLDHTTPEVRYAACLGMAMFMPKKSILDALADKLYHGNEDLRRCVAECYARFAGIGYQRLKEAAVSEDFMVRRAAVYGLIQIPHQWAGKILEKMSIEDGQWVVRNAALQALEVRSGSHSRIPKVLPHPSNSPWLVTYAGKLGRGISGGSMAWDLLIKIMNDGTEEEKITALEYLKNNSETEIQKAIFQGLKDPSPRVREASYWAFVYLKMRYQSNGSESPRTKKSGTA